jgi:hypothetical protein
VASKLAVVDGLGKMLMGLGAGLFFFGLLIVLANKIGWLRLGRLPGDISVHRDGFSFYFPLVTCLLLSLVGTLVFWLIGAFKR